MIVIAHNLDVIKTADWNIELGPEGGNKEGKVIATGTPEDIASIVKSFTGEYLKQTLICTLGKRRVLGCLGFCSNKNIPVGSGIVESCTGKLVNCSIVVPYANYSAGSISTNTTLKRH